MILPILALPLVSSLLIFLFGRYLTDKGVFFYSFISGLFSTFFSIILVYEAFTVSFTQHLTFCPFIHFEAFTVFWEFYADKTGSIMLAVVTLISFLVHVYSIGYMRNDPHVIRFFALLSLFTFCMLLLISSPTLLQFFVGWEGVGLCSYLLVCFWYTRTQANTSAIKAFVINRVGDLGFLLGLLLCVTSAKSVDFTLFSFFVPFFSSSYLLVSGYYFNILSCLLLFLFCGTMSKSAQIFLHTWLPDAMEGPTPVSALIHAATMVAAGVFLLIKCSPIILPYSFSANCIVILGAFTTFFAASVAFFQNDVKKIIAYSTCSQLGYMVTAAGLCVFNASFFHLINHAFFKALLFLSSGALIHSLFDNQDIRRMGNLALVLPFTLMMFLLGSFALIAFPFFSGFYSKDLILEAAFFSTSFISHSVFYLLLIAALLTSFYSLRLLFTVFFNSTNLWPNFIRLVFESNTTILLPIACLAFFSLFFGFFSSDFFTNLRLELFGVLTSSLDYEFVSYLYKTLPFLFSTSFVSIALLLTFKSNSLPFLFFSKKWLFDAVYNFFISGKFFFLSFAIFFQSLDKGFFEFSLPFTFVNIISKLAFKVKSLQTGFAPQYFLYFLLSILSISLVSLKFFTNIKLELFILFMFSLCFMFFGNKKSFFFLCF